MGKNHETQSRREFFKEAARKTLPILGAVALLSNPLIAKVTDSERMDCYGSCYNTCANTCVDACNQKCSNSCSGSCRGNCLNGCKNRCSGTCKGDCMHSCKGVAYYG